jgi:hypothetical protein
MTQNLNQFPARIQPPTREVAHGEFFSGASEPTITFRKPKIKLNMVCLKEMTAVDNVLFVVYPREKKLANEPCGPDVRVAIRWSSLNPVKRQPKVITCLEFYRRISELMRWEDDCRYKVRGKVTSDSSGKKIIFDLNAALIFRPEADGKISQTPEYPQSWSESFGTPADEHANNPLVKRFAADTEIKNGME